MKSTTVIARAAIDLISGFGQVFRDIFYSFSESSYFLGIIEAVPRLFSTDQAGLVILFFFFGMFIDRSIDIKLFPEDTRSTVYEKYRDKS